MRKPRKTPKTIRTMAYHRGLYIHKAKRGGWYITLSLQPGPVVLYATHDWGKIVQFIITYPILIKRSET